MDLDFNIIDEGDDLLADVTAVAPPKSHQPFLGDTTPVLKQDSPDITFDDEDETQEDKKTSAKTNTEDKAKPVEQTEVDLGENQEVEDKGDDTFQKLADNLVEMGIFSPDGEEDKLVVTNSEEFAQRFQKSAEKTAVNRINEIVGQFGPEYHEAFEAIYVNGLNPYEYFSRVGEIDSFESMDLENEDSQKQVYREYMKRQGFAPERIEEKLQRIVDLGELETEAKDYHGVLVAGEKKALQQRTEQAAIDQQKQAKYEQDYQQSAISVLTQKITAKEFDGIPLNQKKAQETLNYIFDKNRYRMPNGQGASEMDKFIYDLNRPENIELKIKVALLAQEGFKTTAIQKEAVKKESNKLFQNLANKEKHENRAKGQQKKFDPFEF